MQDGLDEINLCQFGSKRMERPVDLLDSSWRWVAVSCDIVGELPLRHPRDTRQSRERKLATVICKERCDIVCKFELKLRNLVREVNTECIHHSHKVLLSLLWCGTLTYGIEMKVIVIRHICAIHSIISTFYKHSYIPHNSHKSNEEEPKIDPSRLLIFLFESGRTEY